MSVLDDARITLQGIANDEKVGAHLRIGAVNRLLQLERLAAAGADSGGDDVLPDAPVLTPSERSALRDALAWPEAGLWDKEQRGVVLKLGLWTEAELADEVAATKPKRQRRR